MATAYVRSLRSDTQLGVLISSALWGIASIQTVTYYRTVTFKSDRVLLKVAVGVAWLSDTIYVVLVATNQYKIIANGIFIMTLPLSASVFGAIVQSVVQVTYALRLYRLSNQRWIPLICCTGAAYEFITIILYGVWLLNVNFFENQIKYRWLITSSYIVSPIVDVIITGTFCYQLKKDRQYIRRRTAHIIDRLVLWTIESGLITSLTAIVIVIMELILTLSTSAFLVIMPTLYLVTLLALLNARSELRSMNDRVIDEMTSFNFQVTTQSESGKSIPVNVPIGPQATDSLNATSTQPQTCTDTNV